MLLFEDVGSLLSARGMAAAGVVAGHPPEHLAATRWRVGPAGPTPERLALERGVERRLGQGVVGAGPDRPSTLPPGDYARSDFFVAMCSPTPTSTAETSRKAVALPRKPWRPEVVETSESARGPTYINEFRH